MVTFLFWTNIISAFCSITGYSVIGIFRYFFSKTKYMKVLIIKPYVIAASVILSISLLLTWSPWSKLYYGDVPKKIVYRDISLEQKDTSKNAELSAVKIKQTSKVPTRSVNVSTVQKTRKRLKKDTTSKGQFNLPNATFNAPTQLGNGNTQYNQLGVKPREVTKAILNDIQIHYADKNLAISIFRTTNDNESYQFALKLAKSLNDIGYKNIIVNGVVYDTPISNIEYGTEMGDNAIILPGNE
jgi:hypothetical protein